MTADRGTVRWDILADRLIRAQQQMYDEGWRGGNPTAEALRRAFTFVPAGESKDGYRTLPYDNVWSGHGLVTKAEVDHLLESHTIADRMAREAAEKRVAEMREETARVYREAGQDLANLIRGRCNDRTVPSKYRREGVQWAANLIDPRVPKDRYGDPLGEGEKP